MVSYAGQPQYHKEAEATLEIVLRAIGFSFVHSIDDDTVLMYAPVIRPSFWGMVNDMIEEHVKTPIVVSDLKSEIDHLTPVGEEEMMARIFSRLKEYERLVKEMRVEMDAHPLSESDRYDLGRKCMSRYPVNNRITIALGLNTYAKEVWP
ncbi:MAG: hypothetical protein EA392_09805 [Cryomorphaceae bacterium]|nr:MAG: hypothetical protein EA392_09805 [Cryomorphaceae bacterium]